MAFNLHEAIDPHLLQRGFERRKKTYRRSGHVTMEVWFNPENRLRRIRTINVTCRPGSAADGDGPSYTFDQYSAATDLRGVLGGGYEPGPEGWPGVMAQDFAEVTVPFIDRATSMEAIVRMVLDATIPPELGRRGLHGQFSTAYELADQLGLDAEKQEALDLTRGRVLSWGEYDSLQSWARLRQVELDLTAPPFDLRRWFAARLPVRYGHHVWRG